MTTLLRIAPEEARRRGDAAQLLGARQTVTGEPLAPILAASSAALGEGSVSAAQVGVLARCLRELPRPTGSRDR
ncbi:MAG TPA: hypothetical protein VGN18_16870 [Jatrophihabitans sp.]|uniref:hypothetical protein n=1 Tax=Jatrophihabitans sp. TaxID=1932789 RepID=UPI002E03A495|nr:hypothetical protein [Jatrophihabitans sp.]